MDRPPKGTAGGGSEARDAAASHRSRAGQGRGLLATIGAPIVNALSTLGSLSSDLASQTGLEHGPALLPASAMPDAHGAIF